MYEVFRFVLPVHYRFKSERKLIHPCLQTGWVLSGMWTRKGARKHISSKTNAKQRRSLPCNFLIEGDSSINTPSMVTKHRIALLKMKSLHGKTVQHLTQVLASFTLASEIHRKIDCELIQVLQHFLLQKVVGWSPLRALFSFCFATFSHWVGAFLYQLECLDMLP